MSPRTQAIVGWLLGALAYWLIAGCATEVRPPTGGAAIIGEQLCSAYGYTCGHVYEFDQTPAENELGVLELCVTEADLPTAQTVYGPAQLSTHPRFEARNLCLYQCPSARGCNAFNGCFCSGAVYAGVPVSGWEDALARMASPDCETSIVKPAIACGRLQILDFDGCRWHCVRIVDLDRGERQ